MEIGGENLLLPSLSGNKLTITTEKYFFCYFDEVKFTLYITSELRSHIWPIILNQQEKPHIILKKKNYQNIFCHGLVLGYLYNLFLLILGCWTLNIIYKLFSIAIFSFAIDSQAGKD